MVPTWLEELVPRSLSRRPKTHLGGAQYLLQTQITSVDAAGAPIPWVAAGVAGPGGPFVAWRIDLGDFAAVPDKLTPDQPWSVDSAMVEAFGSAGASLGAFPLNVDSSDATGLSGVGLLGIGGDISGLDVASLQVALHGDCDSRTISVCCARGYRIGLWNTALGKASLGIALR